VAEIPASSHAHAHTAPNDIDSAVTRSQFLTLTTVGLGAMIGAVIGVPATSNQGAELWFTQFIDY